MKIYLYINATQCMTTSDFIVKGTKTERVCSWERSNFAILLQIYCSSTDCFHEKQTICSVHLHVSMT